MGKWEYCVIGSLEDSGHLRSLYRLTEEGAEMLASFASFRSAQPKGGKLEYKDSIAQTMARLGEDDWEMLGVAMAMERFTCDLYFKRPKIWKTVDNAHAWGLSAVSSARCRPVARFQHLSSPGKLLISRVDATFRATTCLREDRTQSDVVGTLNRIALLISKVHLVEAELNRLL